MKHRVEIGGKAHEVETLTSRHVRVDGEDLFLEIAEGHVLHEGHSFRAHVRRDPKGAPIAVVVEGVEVRVALEDPMAGRPGRRGRSEASRGASSGRVTAPMNGQVVNVLKRAGEQVAQGEVVLVLEAMKMENEVSAPVGGRLSSIQVEKGATVRSGDPLFIIDPDEAPADPSQAPAND